MSDRDFAPSERMLDNLDAIQLDPHIRKVFTEIDELNLLIAGERLLDWEIIEIITGVDKKWATLIDQVAVVTADATVIGAARGSERSKQRQFFDKVPMAFRGVVWTECEMSRDYPDRLERGTYKLGVGFQEVVPFPEGESVKGRNVSTTTDMVHSMEFSGHMSLERAQAVLEYYYPKLIAAIDNALCGEYLEECQTVLSLSDVEANFAGLDENIRDVITEALNLYCNHLLRFDQELPYHMAVQGDTWTYVGETLEAVRLKADDPFVCRVNAIGWIVATDDADRVLPYLHTSIPAKHRDILSTNSMIPVAAITNFTSDRYSAYTGY